MLKNLKEYGAEFNQLIVEQERGYTLVERVSFVLLSLFIFLLPLFVVPFTDLSLGLSKSLLFTFAVVLLAVFAIVSRMSHGNVTWPKGWLLPAIFLVGTTYLISASFSGNVDSAFLGYGNELATFFQVVMGFALIDIILFVVKGKNRVTFSFVMLFVPFGLLAIWVLARALEFNLFSTDVLSFGLFTGLGNTPVGNFADLSLYAGLFALLSLIAFEFRFASVVKRTLAITGLVASLTIVALTNVSYTWYLLGAFSVGLIIYFYVKNMLDTRPAGTPDNVPGDAHNMPILPIVIFIISLVFIFSNGVGTFVSSRLFPTNDLVVSLDWSSTKDIASDVLTSGAKNALIGVGPNRFTEFWQLNKSLTINESAYWDTDFAYANGFVPTTLITTGLFGLIAWILFLLFLVTLGIRSLRNIQNTWSENYLILFSFVGSLYLWLVLIFYVPNQTLVYLTFVMTGLFLASASTAGLLTINTFTFTTNKKRAGFAIVSVIAIIFVVIFGQSYVKRILSTYYVERAAIAISSGEMASAQDYLALATTLHTSDRLHVTASKLFIAGISQMVGDQTLQQNDVLKNQLLTMMQGAVDNALLATKLDAEKYENFTNLGDVYTQVAILGVNDSFALAEKAYETARTLNPQNPETYLLKARLEYSRGDRKAAMEAIQQALVLKTNYIEAYNLLWQLAINTKDYGAAEEALSQIAVIDATNPSAYYNLGLLRYEMKAYEEASEAFESAVSLSPDYSNALYYLALSYDKLGREGEAVSLLTMVLKTNPDDATVLDLMSNLESQIAAKAKAKK